MVHHGWQRDVEHSHHCYLIRRVVNDLTHHTRPLRLRNREVIAIDERIELRIHVARIIPKNLETVLWERGPVALEPVDAPQVIGVLEELEPRKCGPVLPLVRSLLRD